MATAQNPTQPNRFNPRASREANAAVGGQGKVIQASYPPIHEAIRALVKRAVKSGDVRKEIDPIDLLQAQVGVVYLDTP